MPVASVSLNSLRFSVVGPGRVGSSLAHWLVARGATLCHVASRNRVSAQELLLELGGHWTHLDQTKTAEEDLLLIAVSDPALPAVVSSLSRRGQAAVALHTSGRVSSEVLAPLRSRGSSVGSLHPLKAFSSITTNPSAAAGIVFGIDGDNDARSLASQISSSLLGIPVTIPAAARSHYHLAATTVAGGIITLLATAAELAQRAGLGEEVVAGYLSLAAGAIEDAGSISPIAAAITGPIARGDLPGMLEQIDAVRTLDGDLADFLEALAYRTRYHSRATADESELPRS